MKKMAQFAVALGVAAGIASTALGESLEVRRGRLSKLAADEYEYELVTHPERATKYGDKRYNDRLADYSMAFVQQDLARKRQFLAAARAIDTTGFTEQEKLTQQVLVYVLALEVDVAPFKPWENPADILYGPQVVYAVLPGQTQFSDAKDYENYLKRLQQYPRVFDQLIAMMKLGMRDRIMQPRYILEKIAGQARKVAAMPPEQSVFLAPLQHFPASVSAADQQRLSSAIRAAVREDVIPAYTKFSDFVGGDYANHARQGDGVWDTPDGAARYRFAVRQMTTAHSTPAEIHAQGLKLVDEIEKEMLALAQKLGYSDLKSFHEHIRSDRALYGKSSQEVFDLYALHQKQMQERLPMLFTKLPKARLELVPTESFRAPQAMPAEYFPGARDGSRPGHLSVNEYAPEKRLLLNLEAICYHEGYPGHHLQISLQNENADLPEFRRQSPYENYSYAAYVEGWGFYAEQLGKDAGLYTDPYSDYGRLENMMWRAIRLVEDTGVHSMHWTRAQMIEYFHEHTAMDEPNIESEVDRYIAWPGQALSYMMGEQEFMQLRAEAKNKLGNRFRIQTFHDELLANGALPLDILDQHMQEWIEEQAQRK